MSEKVELPEAIFCMCKAKPVRRSIKRLSFHQQCIVVNSVNFDCLVGERHRVSQGVIPLHFAICEVNLFAKDRLVKYVRIRQIGGN